jgi:hypothetical protein
MVTKRDSRSGLALKLFLCLIALGVAKTISAATATAAPAIVTHDGPLKGIETPAVNEYLGIPYAVAPVGYAVAPVGYARGGRLHRVLARGSFSRVAAWIAGDGFAQLNNCPFGLTIVQVPPPVT